MSTRKPTAYPLYRVTTYGRFGTTILLVTELPKDRVAAYGPRHTIERIR